MRYVAIAALGLSLVAVAVATDVLGPAKPVSGLQCVQINSSGSTDCQDAGGFPSKCAKATCPSGYTLTGGGGSCSAGNIKIKSLFPKLNDGEFAIACEEQGVDPDAHAICCKL